MRDAKNVMFLLGAPLYVHVVFFAVKGHISERALFCAIFYVDQKKSTRNSEEKNEKGS